MAEAFRPQSTDEVSHGDADLCIYRKNGDVVET